jgi:EmrB/QacA subfamily drug resistance transporter
VCHDGRAMSRTQPSAAARDRRPRDARADAAAPAGGRRAREDAGPPAGPLSYGSRRGRWVLAATVLGSGVASLDATVVNVALPALGRDLHAGFTDLEWTVNAYTLSLGSFILLGGALGDRLGRRRMFLTGLAIFVTASLLCGLAPSIGLLVAARLLQGVGGALLTPESLAILTATFRHEDRGRAIGAWSGMQGLASALGPLVGGYLAADVSWRLVFLLNVPVAALAAGAALRHVPETRDPAATGAPDLWGALLAVAGLGGVVLALMRPPGWSGPAAVASGLAGGVALLALLAVERRARVPMLPLSLFRDRQFSGANATTLLVYGALGCTFLLVVLQLQEVAGYSAVTAGASMLPVTVLMLLLSSRTGALAQRIGPRIPMTVGPLVVAGGLLLLGRIGPRADYPRDVLPGMLVFGLGLACTVAPLTAAVLGAVEERHAGVASAVNNAIARVAGLLAVAILPLAAGMTATRLGSPAYSAAYGRTMTMAAALCALGGAVAVLTVRRGAEVEPTALPSLRDACHDPCRCRRVPRAPAPAAVAARPGAGG